MKLEQLVSAGLPFDCFERRGSLKQRDVKTILQHYEALQNMGLSSNIIHQNLNLLEQDPETLRKHYAMLRSFGIPSKNIQNRARLLSRSSNTLKQRYEHYSSQVPVSVIRNQPQLLLMSQPSFDDSVQWHSDTSISYGNGAILGVSAPKKESKVVWYSDYNSVTRDCAINFFKAKPYYLQKSVKRLKTLC